MIPRGSYFQSITHSDFSKASPPAGLNQAVMSPFAWMSVCVTAGLMIISNSRATGRSITSIADASASAEATAEAAYTPETLLVDPLQV